MTLEMIIELMVVLLALWVGSRYGSLALGGISGIGLAILVFCFGLAPGNPPTEVIFIIVATVTCIGVLQAAGGLDFMTQLAERVLRRHPSRITILAPLTTFLFTVFLGTGNAVYALMPIISDIALKKGIRPERPCAVASIASQVGITCSPISAAMIAFVGISAANDYPITNLQVMSVTIPACIIGILMAVAYSWHRGRDLDKDKRFQTLIKDPEQYAAIYGNSVTTLDKAITKEGRRALYIFFAALAVIVIVAVFQFFGHNILPSWPTVKVVDGVETTVTTYLRMNHVIQIVMLSAAALMILFCKVSPKKAVASAVWQSGMVAVVAIYGIAWMSDTYFIHYVDQMKGMLAGIAVSYPWMMSLAFFLVSVLINSQGATVIAILPLAYQLGIEGWILVGILPSVYGYFFLPNYPSDLATINFDRSGTTVIGRFLFNHSFMLPGLIHVVAATIVGYALAFLYHQLGLI